MFSMSKAEWNENAISINGSGLGIAKGELTDGLTLVTVVPTGYIAINPYYEVEKKPNFLSVTIGYKEPYSSSMSKSEFYAKHPTELFLHDEDKQIFF